MKESFEVTTHNYESDRKLMESILAEVELGLHESNIFELSEPSNYLGWTFFTISVDTIFIVRMIEVYESCKNAKGWTHYEKFENWLNDRMRREGSKATVKVIPQS